MSDGKALSASGPAGELTLVAPAQASSFRFQPAGGCPAYPEVEIDVERRAVQGRRSPYGEVARLRRRAHPRDGLRVPRRRRAHCGRPWTPVRRARRARRLPRPLRRTARARSLENAVSYGNPAARHDPVGWPTFKDWPAPDSLTHEQHLLQVARARLARRPADLRQPARREQRALRDLPAQAATPATRWTRSGCRRRTCTSCRTTSTRRTAARARAGSGSSPTPFQARRVINAGQARGRHGHRDLASCSAAAQKPAYPTVHRRHIDQQLDEVYGLGVRTWSWSTSSTTRSPASPATTATTGDVVNSGNILETGSVLGDADLHRARDARPRQGADRSRVHHSSDALFGAVARGAPAARRAAGLPGRPALQRARPDRRSASTLDQRA